MVWYGMVWYGMEWYGMVWYGMVWYGMVWYGICIREDTDNPVALSNSIVGLLNVTRTQGKGHRKMLQG